MTTLEVGKRLVALMRQGKALEIVNTMMAADVASVEAFGDETMPQTMNGPDAIRGKNEWWFANHKVHSASVRGPFPHENRFAVVYDFEVTPAVGPVAGKRIKMEEVAIYTVGADGKISKEEFFYDVSGGPEAAVIAPPKKKAAKKKKVAKKAVRAPKKASKKAAKKAKKAAEESEEEGQEEVGADASPERRPRWPSPDPVARRSGAAARSPPFPRSIPGRPSRRPPPGRRTRSSRSPSSRVSRRDASRRWRSSTSSGERGTRRRCAGTGRRSRRSS
jgi:hypothetical protein